MNKDTMLLKFIEEHPEHRFVVGLKKTIQKEAEKYARQSTLEEFTQKKVSAKRFRAEKMFDMYKSGQSLQEVGDEFGITRERVRQVLKSFFAEDHQLAKQESRAIRKMPETVDVPCKHCGTSFTKKRTAQARFCSDKCKFVHQGYPDWIQGRPMYPEAMTKEEWRIINNIRMKLNYKKNPRIREKAKEWYHKNKEKQYIFAKRWAERKKYGHAITPLLKPKNFAAIRP